MLFRNKQAACCCPFATPTSAWPQLTWQSKTATTDSKMPAQRTMHGPILPFIMSSPTQLGEVYNMQHVKQAWPTLYTAGCEIASSIVVSASKYVTSPSCSNTMGYANDPGTGKDCQQIAYHTFLCSHFSLPCSFSGKKNIRPSLLKDMMPPATAESAIKDVVAPNCGSSSCHNKSRRHDSGVHLSQQLTTLA